MPRVPTYDSFQATPSTVPLTRLDAPQTYDFAGRQAQQLGESMQRAGDSVGRMALDMQQQANQLRVDDALNQAKEAALRLTYDKDAGFTNLRGINALQRPDGKPLAEEYGDNLKGTISQIADGLGNDAQKQAFGLHANDILTSFRGQAIQHEANEFKTYGLSVSEGVQSTALRDIGLNWNNPDAVNSAVERIRAETYRQAQLLGKSAEWQDAQARKLTSNAHKVALMSALEQNDPAYADSYLKKYSEQMDADDILAVRGHITKEMDARIGVGAASDVIRKLQPRIQTSEAERAFNIAVGTESGGRQFGADGKPLTSPKGAVGIAQLMPTTAPEAAKLAGLPWDENRYKTDANYNKAIGLAYFQKQLQDNGGDLAKAYAAYNAGPGRLQEAVKKAETSAKLHAGDPKVPQYQWLDFMPAETKAYVAKNMKEYDAGQGQAQRPTFQEIDDMLRADPRLANNPSRYKVAREEANRQYEEQTKSIKQREDEAVATAMRGIIQNGGRFSDLPVSVRAAVPPKEVDNLIGFAQKIAKGDDSTNLALYQKLATDQNYLRNLSDNDFFRLRSQLSESDFKHFAAERTSLLTGQKGNPAEDLNTQAINTVLADRLRTLNINPHPNPDDDNGNMRVGAINKFVRESILASQSVVGKKFTDAEVEKHIDGLFAKSQDFRMTFLGVGAGKTSQRLLTMTVGDIPGEIQDKLKADFKAAGVPNPTDADLLGAYWQLKFAKR